MDIFKLTRSYWDFSFSNPEKIKPIHTAIYFFAIEHCNRLAWKEKFWFPTSMAMEAIWISNYWTYKKWLDDLVAWWFIKMIEVSKNQYSSNIISLTQIVWSTDKALDKALIKHNTKHTLKRDESIASIDIQDTNVPYTNLQETDTNVSSQAIVPLDHRNKWTQRIIDIVKSQVEQEWFLYDNNKDERNRATIIAKRQSDWWNFIKDTPEEQEEDYIRKIISFSNQNEYTSKIRSVKDFHEKWKRVANSMKETSQEIQKKQFVHPNPLLRF